MIGRLVVVGDALLDRDVDGQVERLCPEAPVPVLDRGAVRCRPGGAGLAAALAAADGHAVTLVTALARDEAGRQLASALDRSGVHVVDLGLSGRTPTKTRFRTGGRLLLRVDGGGSPGRVGRIVEPALDALRRAAAILVADYGRGLAAGPRLRAALAEAALRLPVVWDPHPHGAEPVPAIRIATPNRAEAVRLFPEPPGDSLHVLTARAHALMVRWRAEAVAVTLGARGALLVRGEAPPLLFPAQPADHGDPCGAGDRFASALAALLGEGRWLPDAVAGAVEQASAYVAAGGASRFASAPLPPPVPAAPESAEQVVARVRAAGGTVVATGGCFDLIHAGHVAMLRAARSLGECLVVCLNSDDSVRRLKGRDRPLVPEEDRAAVLSALGCVDAVAIFDEDTPAEILERLRPDVFAKGGDYALEELPEAQVVARWGGQGVVLPYVEGRSTTRLLEEVALRAGA